MAKRILVVAASPRKDGNSDLLCERFIEGALEAGNIVEEVKALIQEPVVKFLAELHKKLIVRRQLVFTYYRRERFSILNLEDVRSAKRTDSWNRSSLLAPKE